MARPPVATRNPASRWRPQLACPTTVLRRKKEASRRHSALLYDMERLLPAQHGARASQPRVLRLLPRDSDRNGAPARLPGESRLCVGGRGWHVAPRSYAEGERHLARVVPLYKVCTDHTQRGTAPARRKCACSASFRETAGVVKRVTHAKAGCAFEAAAGTSHHGLAPKKRGISP